MGRLARLLTALEEIAEAARLRPYRTIAAELGCPLEELLAEVAQEEALYARLRAQGRTVQQIVEQVATEQGVTVEALERELDQIELRYF